VSELHRLVVLERMRDVLSLLTPGEMLAVALRFECEMSFSEIGDELGISKQAVALRFRTAQDRLAREIPELARRKDNGNGSHAGGGGHRGAGRGPVAARRRARDGDAGLHGVARVGAGQGARLGRAGAEAEEHQAAGTDGRRAGSVGGIMTPRPKHTRRDVCQKELVDGLRAAGFVVWDLADVGGEILDTVCFFRGTCLPVEVKCNGALTPDQERSVARLRAVGVEPIVAGTAEEVVAAWPEH